MDTALSKLHHDVSKMRHFLVGCIFNLQLVESLEVDCYIYI
jgi:hypothetical protein